MVISSLRTLLYPFLVSPTLFSNVLFYAFSNQANLSRPIISIMFCDRAQCCAFYSWQRTITFTFHHYYTESPKTLCSLPNRTSTLIRHRNIRIFLSLAKALIPGNFAFSISLTSRIPFVTLSMSHLKKVKFFSFWFGSIFNFSNYRRLPISSFLTVLLFYLMLTLRRAAKGLVLWTFANHHVRTVFRLSSLRHMLLI